MNGRERFLSCLNFEKGSSTVKGEMSYWFETVTRWEKEGLPYKKKLKIATGHNIRGNLTTVLIGEDIVANDVFSYFNFDVNSVAVPSTFSPFFKTKIINDSKDFILFTDDYGNTIKRIKDKTGGIKSGMPMYTNRPVKSKKDFYGYKERYDLNFEKRLKKGWINEINDYRNKDYIIWLGTPNVGFFWYLRLIMGTEMFLMKMHDDPGLIKEILYWLTDYVISFWGYILGKTEVDIVQISEDMAYRGGPLLSPAMFKEFLLPCYKRLTSFLRSSNVKNIFVDSDGNINLIVPLLMEGGINGLLPMEVQAGMDIVMLRKQYPKLKIIGGINKMNLFKGRIEIKDELEKIPFMLKEGGYIPTIDHSVPPDISWENYKFYRNNLNLFIDKHQKK